MRTASKARQSVVTALVKKQKDIVRKAVEDAVNEQELSVSVDSVIPDWDDPCEEAPNTSPSTRVHVWLEKMGYEVEWNGDKIDISWV